MVYFIGYFLYLLNPILCDKDTAPLTAAVDIHIVAVFVKNIDCGFVSYSYCCVLSMLPRIKSWSLRTGAILACVAFYFSVAKACFYDYICIIL